MSLDDEKKEETAKQEAEKKKKVDPDATIKIDNLEEFLKQQEKKNG